MVLEEDTNAQKTRNEGECKRPEDETLYEMFKDMYDRLERIKEHYKGKPDPLLLFCCLKKGRA